MNVFSLTDESHLVFQRVHEDSEEADDSNGFGQ